MSVNPNNFLTYRVQVPDNNGMDIMTFVEVAILNSAGQVISPIEVIALIYYNHERKLQGLRPIDALPTDTIFTKLN
jgi:hypothetical protein